MEQPVISIDHTKQIISRLPAAVFEYTLFPDGQRDFTFLSPHCEEIFETSSEVLISGVRSMESYVHAGDRAQFLKEFLKWIKNGLTFSWQGRIVTPNEKIKWVEAIGTPNKTEDGRIVWVGLFTDVTSKKQIEFERKKEQERIAIESEGRYRELVETLPLGIIIYQEGNLVFANQAAATLLGAKTIEELLGLPPLNFIHPDSQGRALDRLADLMAGKTIPTIDQKYVRLDGKEIIAEVSAHTLIFRGKVSIQIIFKDATEERETLHAKRKTETLFSQLFKSSPFGLVMLDEKGKVVQVNEGFEKLFGYTSADLAGQSLNDYIVPAELESEGNDLNTLISSEQIVKIESRRIHKNKSERSVIIYGVPVPLENKTISIFGVYVDITSQKKVEEELKVRNIELDNFVYKVSHDLRAPLSSVLGLVNLAQLDGNDDNLADYIKIIGQKVKQLDHFISDVLSHSKNLKLDVKIEKIGIEQLIHQTFTDLGYLKGADKIKTKIIVEGEDFYSDPWRIGEILRNLISNAIKYRDFEKSESIITIEIKVHSDRAVIIFSDNGIGISPINQAKIFDMFYRASEQSDGSGLGLYIVKNAVDKLGGLLKVTSELSKGTKFELKLPNHLSSNKNS